MWGFQLIHQQIAEGGRYDQRDDGYIPVQNRTGVG